MTAATGDAYETFAERAAEYDVELHRVPAAEATDTIAEIVEKPAVGAALPWEDVALPEGVATEPTPAELDAAVTGVTAAALGVADYGSVLLRSTPDGAEPASLFPDLHVFVLREEDVVPDMAAAFEWVGERFREAPESAILATGPSATADMGELVEGAHGPKTVTGVVIE
ncbi:MAG: L-lactate dehydrogenase complex protein LldG [Halobacteriales archaeon]|jgi:L-lactate dehydrogenase complex protein LldG